MNITIIDYNSGNLASLQNSLESAVKNNKQTFEVKITAVPEEVIKADKLILPGVGDFFYCKNELLKICIYLAKTPKSMLYSRSKSKILLSESALLFLFTSISLKGMEKLEQISSKSE